MWRHRIFKFKLRLSGDITETSKYVFSSDVVFKNSKPYFGFNTSSSHLITLGPHSSVANFQSHATIAVDEKAWTSEEATGYNIPPVIYALPEWTVMVHLVIGIL